jgi:hypothetical protein
MWGRAGSNGRPLACKTADPERHAHPHFRRSRPSEIATVIRCLNPARSRDAIETDADIGTAVEMGAPRHSRRWFRGAQTGVQVTIGWHGGRTDRDEERDGLDREAASGAIRRRQPALPRARLGSRSMSP